MLNFSYLKKSFYLFVFICILSIPSLVIAGGHGGGCCGGMGMGMGSSYSPYYMNYGLNTGRLSNLLGYGYGGLNPYSYGGYGYGGYPTVIGGPSYGGYNYGMPYGASSYGLYSPFGYGQNIVTGRDYGVTDSYTTYTPWGSHTVSQTETTETSTLPNYFSGYNPYGYGLGSYSPFGYGGSPFGTSWI